MCTAVVGGSIHRLATSVSAASDQRTAVAMRSHRTKDRRKLLRSGVVACAMGGSRCASKFSAVSCASGFSATLQNNRLSFVDIAIGRLCVRRELSTARVIMPELLQRLRDSEHFVGAGADTNVFCEIAPAHCAARIDQEFGGSRNVGAIRAGGSVQQMILPDHFGFGVAEDRECVAGFAGEIARHTRRVHADGYGANARGLEFGKIFFDAS